MKAMAIFSLTVLAVLLLVASLARAADIPSTFKSDHEFDLSSKITIESLNPQQIELLLTLSKVWGFLKYHHPAITSGLRNWDYDLFRILPTVLAARNRTAAVAAITDWVSGLGPILACSPCATLDGVEPALQPNLQWIADERLLGSDLSRALRAAYAARPADGNQFYVSRMPAGNPKFEHELPYPAFHATDAGLQLLALFRFWNIVEYWSPYRNLITDWDQVLRDSIPRLALAKTFEDYQLQLMRLTAAVQDTHTNLWSSLELRPPVGACQLPIILRYVENRFIVTDYASNNLGEASRLRLGDSITAIDGVSVTKMVFQNSPYYADSNDATRYRDLARSLTRGACGSAAIEVTRGDTLTLNLNRVDVTKLDLERNGRHDRPGDTFQILPTNVAYLKLSSVKANRIDQYLKAAADAKGLIIDIRTYPSDFVVFALGSHLVQKDTPFVRFASADLSNPGVFRWQPATTISPKTPYYPQEIVVLVDETSQSQAEYSAMALRATPNATVLGSTTAGADGNISAIQMPGKLYSLISGLGVFYPDKKPTQRIGIVPDIEVRPTIAGIRAGRDEVLGSAVAYILRQPLHTGEADRSLVQAQK